MKINYITKIEGNEAVLDRYVEAVFAQTCKPAKIYPFPYQLAGYENCLDSPLIEYFLQRKPFVLEKAIEFFEKLRKIDKDGFNGIHYPFDKWIEATILKPFFTNAGNNWNVRLVLRPDVDTASINHDYIKFMCYLAVCHMKYGPSFASVTANRYFGMATGLGSDEVTKLKKFGSGELPQETTEYKDENLSCVANDAFATIKVTVKNETAESYQRVLHFINRLLQTNFPRSYSISFSSKQKSWLPIKGLPKKGVHALFANAVRYESLHPLLVEYAHLAMKTHEWYNNLESEDCAMPSTFAVFALGLQSEAYFGLVKKYMQNVDDEHQSIQERFTAAFVEKYGINEKTLPIFISCLFSTQSHKHYKLFAEQFSTPENLKLLLAERPNIWRYFPKEDEPEQKAKGSSKANDYIWEYVLYTVFGSQQQYQKLTQKASEELRPLYAALLVGNSVE